MVLKKENKKIKVIHIAHASHSYFANEGDNLRKIVLNDWYFKTASQIKKYYPVIDLECWAPEKDNKEYEEFVEDGVKLKVFPASFSLLYGLDFSMPMLLALREEVEKSYDKYELIIHLHEMHNLHGLIICDLFRNQKIIVQHHGGSWPMKHLRDNRKKRWFFPLYWLGQIWENRVIKNVDKAYALSSAELDYLKGKKVDSRFQTMGIGNEYFDVYDKMDARGKLGIGKDDKLLFFLGRVGRVKGVDYLLRAMKKLPDVKLKLAGYGLEREELENYANENNLNNVEFLGGVFGDDKLLYLSAADALVLPSMKEGAPVTVMEAMARNLPSVVSDVGGVKLMIDDGDNGIIIKPRDVDGIVKGVREILEWDKDIKKGANRYKWEKIVEDTVKDYGIR